MSFIKQTLKNTASLLVAVGIIGSAYAAISTVSSGDPLTADSWNSIVNKFDGIGENSVKEYVDSTVSASISNISTFPTMITPRQNTATLPNALQACRELSYQGYSDWRLPTLEEMVHFYGYENVASDNTQIWTRSKNLSANGYYFIVTRMSDFHVWSGSYEGYNNSFIYYCVR